MSTSSASSVSPGTPWALVAGAGPGLGHALLNRLSQAGLTSIGLVRSQPPTDTSLDLCQCDLSDAPMTTALLSDLLARHGPPSIVVHNPAELVIAPFTETDPEAFERCWRSMVYSAVVLGQAVLPAMAAVGQGSFIVSGATASLRGGANFAAFASAKFALRGLTQSLARGYQPQGIHVVHTILDGIIDTERSRALHSLDPAKMINAAELAEAYWQLAQQPASVWSHEVDFRPSSESF